MNWNDNKSANAGKSKHQLYRTARATISCAQFKAGDIVSVEYSHQSAENGTRWYDIRHSEHGKLAQEVCYPEHHLTNFVL